MPTSRRSAEHAWRLLWLAVIGLSLLAGGCASQRSSGRYAQTHDGAPSRAIDLASIKDAVPRDEPPSRYGNPQSYVVRGKRYHTATSSQGYSERGIASWYGTKFHGHRTSSGDIYDMYRMSAAHKTLPLPTYARVTNLKNGKSVIVKINDRGPFHENRLIDLSYAAAARLDILGEGTGLVEVTAIDPSRPQKPVPQKRIAPSLPKVATTAQTSLTQEPALYLQLGAFSSRGNAERLRSKLSGLQLPSPPHIISASVNAQPVYRVRIGPLDTIESADRLTQLLADHGIHDPHVIVD